MRLEVFNTISNIDAEKWNQLVSPSDVFHTHEFLKVIEDSKVENAKMSFLCFYKGEELIATSVMSLFTLDLSLFTGGYSLVQFIRKYYNRLFKIDVLFGGTALSAGQKHLFIKSKNDTNEVVRKHLEWVDSYCEKNGVNYSIFKELSQEDIDEYETLFSEKGFFKAYSIPTVKLDLPYPDYSDYLDAFRASYRRQIKGSMKRANMSELLFHDNYWKNPPNEQHPVFTIVNFSQSSPKEFYSLYLQVMSRADVKLETLNQEFFTKLSELKNGPVQLLTMVFKGKVLGYFAFAIKNNVMTFIWTAKKNDKDDFDTYQNLMQALIKHAIKENCTLINLGQTAYYPKMKVGGVPEELFILFKSFSPRMHALILALNNLVFPKLKLSKHRVFKQN